MVVGTLSQVIHESNPVSKVIDYAKKKYKEYNTYDKKRYDKWTKENKESLWNKLNNPLFKVQDKHGETIAGGALKMAAMNAAPIIPLGPAFTFPVAAVTGGLGALSTYYNRYKLKEKYGKHWKEDV